MLNRKSALQRGWLKGLVLIGIFGIGLFLVGCGERVVSPNADDGLQDLIWAQAQLDSAAESPEQVIGWLITTTEQVLIGLLGGTLNFDFGEESATLTIPAGALRLLTMVTGTATHVDLRILDVYIFDFGPDGLTFQKPATLTLETGQAEGTLRRLWWLNPATGSWEYQQTAFVDAHGKISFEIHHFSKYGIN
ncbi:MAG TPA: hypothetical protein VGB22_09965 [candidate division Zixibacteria bacterium]|jgi:hypothetical protein